MSEAQIWYLLAERQVTWSELLDLGLAEDWVADKELFARISEYVKDYKEAPTKAVFEEWGTPLKMTEEPAAYHVDALRQAFAYTVLREATKQANEYLKKRDADGAVELLLTHLHRIEGKQVYDIALAGTAEDVVEEYRRRERGELRGYTFCWERLTKTVHGLCPGNFLIVVARPKVGKTMWLCLHALEWAEQRARVLFITREQTPEDIRRRMVLLKLKLSLDKFWNGEYSEKELKRLERATPDLKGYDVTISGTRGLLGGGIRSVLAKADKLRPDVLVVDGIYLLKDNVSSPTRWERVMNVVDALRDYSLQRNVAVVATSQQGRAGEGGGSLSTLAFSDAIPQYVDVCLELVPPARKDSDFYDPNTMEHRILGIREGKVDRFTTRWDWDKMDWSFVSASEVVLKDEDEVF